MGDLGSILRLGRSSGEVKGYPLQYSCLENSMDCIVHGVAKSWTRLSDFHFNVYWNVHVPVLISSKWMLPELLFNRFYLYSWLPHVYKIHLSSSAECHVISSSLLEWREQILLAFCKTYLGGDLSYTQKQKEHCHFSILRTWRAMIPFTWLVSSLLLLQCSSYKCLFFSLLFHFYIYDSVIFLL